MISSRIAGITAEPLSTPLYHPFVTSQGSADSARAISIRFDLDDGRVAHGESVPVTYVTGETLETVTSAVERIGPQLTGLDVVRFRQPLEIIGRVLPDSPSARCGLEMALMDAWSQATGGSLWSLLGGAVTEIESDVTVPIVPNAAELAAIAWDMGLRVFKLKVGEADVEADHARVKAVRDAVPDARIRLDANQAFTPEGALKFVDRLLAEGAHLQLLEQPVPKEDFEGMDFVARRCAVPVFADETVRSRSDALRLASTAVQGYNLKINKNGIFGVLDIIAIARAAGKRVMLGCMLETRYSIAVSLQIACGTGCFDYLDLDSHLLLNESGTNPYFDQEGGRIALLHP